MNLIRSIIYYFLFILFVKISSLHLVTSIAYIIFSFLFPIILFLRKKIYLLPEFLLLTLIANDISNYVKNDSLISMFNLFTLEFFGISFFFIFFILCCVIFSLEYKFKIKDLLIFFLIFVILLTGSLPNNGNNYFYVFAEIYLILIILLSFLFFKNKNFFIEELYTKLLIIFSLKLIISIIFLFFGYYDNSVGIMIIKNPSFSIIIMFALLLHYLSKGRNKLIAISLFILLTILIISNFQKGYFLQLILVFIFFIFFDKSFSYEFNKTKVLSYFSLFVLTPILLLSFFYNNFFQDLRVLYELQSINNILNLNSPRIVEFKNIFYQISQNPFTFLFGEGLGSFFRQEIAFYKSWQMNLSAFTYYEISSDNFYRPHSFINVALLKFGLFGLLFILLAPWIYFFNYRGSLRVNVIEFSIIFYLQIGFFQNINMSVFSLLVYFCMLKFNPKGNISIRND